MILLFTALAGCTGNKDRPEYIIWFDRPAEFFEESFVMGNGKMGASIFGGEHTDSIYLNDITLWSGEPVDPYMNPRAHRFIPLIREALSNENYRLADSLNRFVQGSFSQSYAPAGTFYIDFDHKAEPDNYYRKLDISTAISRVEYSAGSADYSREYFVTFPERVMVIRLTGSHKGSLNFSIGFSSLLEHSISVDDVLFSVNGRAPYHTEPSYRGDMPDAVLFDENRGTAFTVLADIRNTDGKVTHNGSKLVVSDASKAVIIISLATSFAGWDKDPAVEGLDSRLIAGNQLMYAGALDYNELISNHINDYRSFFDRLSIDLGGSPAPRIPMDQRLKKYAGGAKDSDLEELYLQFGRYLLISSSRTPGVPANLQGLWSSRLRPPWSSNYTMNINLEENYWLAGPANLIEMHEPLVGFIGNLSETGSVTAQTFYGVDNGWTAAHNSDIWAMSNPVGDYGQGDPAWANWNMAGAWLSTHLWEHFIFSTDTMYLSSTAYPLMKGAAVFCLEWLVEGPRGYLVTSPSTSPENLYQHPGGYTGATLYGATGDLAMIRELFDKTIRAAEILGRDSLFRNRISEARGRLYPYQVGKRGNLQEWYYDWEDADPKHRHQTHLFGLYPGRHINPESTPALAGACRRSLEIKGDESTGWSKGWRINLWARLRDGNRAYKMYRQLLKYVDPSGQDTDYGGGGGTYPNLLDAHPPFQIDGNFGGAAGLIEMLIQSDENEIILLPALPDAWDKGMVDGLCARGGFEISMEWDRSQLQRSTVKAGERGSTRIRYGGQEVDVELEKGEVMAIKW